MKAEHTGSPYTLLGWSSEQSMWQNWGSFEVKICFSRDPVKTPVSRYRSSKADRKWHFCKRPRNWLGVPRNIAFDVPYMTMRFGGLSPNFPWMLSCRQYISAYWGQIFPGSREKQAFIFVVCVGGVDTNSYLHQSVVINFQCYLLLRWRRWVSGYTSAQHAADRGSSPRARADLRTQILLNFSILLVMPVEPPLQCPPNFGSAWGSVHRSYKD